MHINIMLKNISLPVNYGIFVLCSVPDKIISPNIKYFFQCLEQTGDWFVKSFGESKNERLASILMKCMLQRMKGYLKNFVAKKHLE